MGYISFVLFIFAIHILLLIKKKKIENMENGLKTISLYISLQCLHGE